MRTQPHRDDSLDWTCGQWALVITMVVMTLMPLIHFVRNG